jgi:competence protein ComGC
MQTTPTTATPPAVPAPRKPRRRWRLIGGFLVLLLMAPVTYYFFAGWYSNRQMAELAREIEKEDPHWRWHDLIAQIKPPPDDKNSAVQIMKVQALLKKTPFAPGPKWDNSPKDPLLIRNARLAHDKAELLRAAFAALPKETVLEARKLKDMPEGGFAIEMAENPFALNLNYLQETRAVANLLLCDAVLRAHHDEREGAAESSQAILNMAHALKDQPFLIAQLIRIAEQAIALGALEWTLGQGTVSEPNLAKLQGLLEADAAADGLHQAMRGERAGGHQIYESLRAGKTSFAEMFGTTGFRVSPGERVLDAFPGLVLNGYPEYLRMMNEQVRASKLKDTERMEAFEKLEQQARQHRARGIRGNLLISWIMPATTKMAEAAQRSQAQVRCAIAALAAERYRLKHNNTWPRGLDDLVKEGLLKEVPKDPYDGQPLRLKRTPTGIVVYSVGYDKVDNGGKLDRANLRTPGTDIGFELWDRRGVPPPASEEMP